MPQRNGALPVGQDETVPDPKTEAYAVFSIAMITIWSKLVPVGAAAALPVDERNIRLAIDRATRTLARLLRFRW